MVINDIRLNCTACKDWPYHRFRPSPEAGPTWRCSVCGGATYGSASDAATRHVVVDALERIDELEAFIWDLSGDGCDYDDGCPIGVPLNHYACVPCRGLRLLEKE